MDVEFGNKECDRLETDLTFNAGYSRAIVKAYRKRMQTIRAAPDERAFYTLKSLHYEKLSGNRAHQRSMRLNERWRLILEVIKTDSNTVVVVKGIENYHKG